ncbi:MAG: putative exonuclease [Prokaryotic dsDNA virus sp.]|nr:MAG: putative exonuclease [Prokaryotic dsDNA virus sp.]|tara:strand:- start:517 stop:1143 length:627 start_codon:yes stop_codon:yes gene_type:complete
MDAQRTDEWFAARLGRVTASRIADVMAKTKTGYGAGRKNYMAELLCERLTGAAQERFTNAAMQWGTEQEPMARDAYAFITGRDVEEVGFVDHPSIPMTGASPDGFVGGDGLIEIKCPNTATHLDTLTEEKIERKYLLQMQWQMACTGRAFCDFASYDPRLPAELQLWVKRVDRDADLIAEIEDEVRKFLAELDATEAKLRARYMDRAA